MNKVTKEERVLLLHNRFKRIEEDFQYRRDLFKTYYKENELRLNLKLWKEFDYKQKINIVKQIIRMEDKYLVENSLKMFKLNVVGATRYIADIKDKQLREFGVREK